MRYRSRPAGGDPTERGFEQMNEAASAALS
jgi:hypothetical protein